MLRLSLNASVRNCFAAALSLHLMAMLAVALSDFRSANQLIVVPALDPNVRVLFSPFGGSAAMPRGNTQKSPPHNVSQKQAVKSGKQKQGIATVAPQKQKAATIAHTEKRAVQAISRVAPPVDKKQKQAPPKQAPAQKKQSNKEAAQKNKAPSSPQKQPALPEKIIEKVPEQKSSESLPDEIVVGRAQYEEYRVAREIRSALERTWVAPRGTDSEARCILAVDIDERGGVKKIETRTASGSALFDSAARYAASQTCYPKEVWGKTLVVEFTP